MPSSSSVRRTAARFVPGARRLGAAGGLARDGEEKRSPASSMGAYHGVASAGNRAILPAFRREFHQHHAGALPGARFIFGDRDAAIAAFPRARYELHFGFSVVGIEWRHSHAASVVLGLR